ncbi:MAG: hypothetical protein J7551_06460 [Chloroflexi bacterium]|jgi:hypothetical protein|nr:hypothetical protein [Chloroflexota bacterium]
MPTAQNYSSLFNSELDYLRNLEESQFNNDSFYIRDILLYSWLLYERDGLVRKSELAKYVSPSGEGTIDALMRCFFQIRQVVCVEGATYRFSTEALEAIPQAFNTPPYKLLEPVPYWGDDITGKRLIQYFCGMDRPETPLVQLANNAFRNMLQNFQCEQRGNLLRFTRGKSSFYVYIYVTDGAFRLADADRVGADLLALGALSTNAPVLVCTANTDNNEANDRLRDFPLIYGAWSIELVSLFHYMHGLVGEFDQQRVSQNFLRIFPQDQRSFFSAHHAAQRVREGL